MEGSAGFGAGQLALADSRLALAVLNHLRYQALNKAFGTSREQANVLTAVVLVTAADAMYVTSRRVVGVRPHVTGADATLGAVALRDATLSVAGASNRAVPGFETLLTVAVLGGLAVPAVRRAAHGMRVAEQRLRAAESRIRHERESRYAAARDRFRATVAAAAPARPAS
jgi:hypothetical protein